MTLEGYKNAVRENLLMEYEVTPGMVDTFLGSNEGFISENMDDGLAPESVAREIAEDQMWPEVDESDEDDDLDDDDDLEDLEDDS